MFRICELYTPHWIKPEQITSYCLAQYFLPYQLQIHIAWWMSVSVVVCQESDDVKDLFGCFQPKNILKCSILLNQDYI